MKKRNQIAALLLTMIMMLSIPLTAFAEVDSTILRHSVAYIEVGVELEGNWIGLAAGSGFFVGDGAEEPQYLITNHHVISDFVDFGSGELMQLNLDTGTVYGRSKIRVYFDATDYVEAYLVDSDSIKDIALLRLATPTDKRAALKIMVPDESMVGKTVYAVGYPGIADNIAVESVSTKGENDASVNRGTVSRLLTQTGTGVATIQMDVVIAHGNSGGPLVFENGAAIGINSWSVEGDQEVFYAVSIAEVEPMLRLHNVTYELYSEPGSGSGVPATVLWIVAAVVAIIVIAVVAGILLKKKGGAGRQKSSASGITPTAPVPAEDRADADDSGFRIQAVSGTLEGKRFLLRRKTALVIGRDPNTCTVVFPASTPGVSGRHCEVRFEKGGVYIRDLGSTHGTFLASGQKLAAQQTVKLSEGETFRLGTGSETFVVARKK